MFIQLYGFTQNKNSLHLGAGLGLNLEGDNPIESQIFVSAYHKKWVSEFNYSIMPFTRFGVKNKFVIAIGRSTNTVKRFNMHFLFCLGYFFGTKNNDWDNTEIGYLYRPQINPGMKLGFVYKFKNSENLNFITNVYVNYEQIYHTSYSVNGGSFFYPGVVFGLRYKLAKN